MITNGALEFFEVGEVLGAACGFFGGDEIGLGEVGDGNAVDIDHGSGFPAFCELESGDRGEEIKLARWHADGKLESFLGEVRLGDFDERYAKLPKCEGYFCGVFTRRLDPEVEAFGEAWLGVVGHGITSDDEVMDVMLDEQT